MKSIHKYSIHVGTKIITLPYKAEFLSFGLDARNELSLWFLVDLDEVISQEKKFTVVGTGEELKDTDFYQSNFLGTVTQGSFVWHLFRD